MATKKRGWLIFLIIFGFFVFMSAMFLLGLRSAFEDRPIVEDETVLQLNLSGLITEHFSRDAFSREFEDASLQMYDILKALQMAKEDSRIEGVYLRIGAVACGWAKAQEIRQALLDFKESEKFVTAFIDYCDEKGYYVALSADEIYLRPQTIFEFNGFAASVPFLKDMLTKVGVTPQINSVGKYKSGGDIYNRDSMSREHREETKALISAISEEVTKIVAAERNLDPLVVADAMNMGLFQAEQAFQMNLVDTLLFETEVLDRIAEKIHGPDSDTEKLKTISVDRYAKVPVDEVGMATTNKIALLYVVGDIMPGSSGTTVMGGRVIGSRSMSRTLAAVRDNEHVKAVVLRIESPGGAGIAADEIWAAVEKLRKEKPVIVTMSDVAASGGYWIAMNCDAIVAQPLTMTGSIGVFTTLFDLSGTYDKLGINWETVKQGEFADMFTEKRPMTEAEWNKLRKLNNDFYWYFVNKVASGREKTEADVHEVAQGRVWMGAAALKHGLIDSLGGLSEALQIAKQKAGLAPEDKTEWLVYPRSRSLLETLFDRFSVKIGPNMVENSEQAVLLRQLPMELRRLLYQIAASMRVRAGEKMALAVDLPVIQ